MNIQEYIKECYEIAQSKGFYPNDSKIEDHLMGIVSEISEAYEAHRCGKFACSPKEPLNSGAWWHELNNLQGNEPQVYYKQNLSGTFEDELADIFIRLFNLYGWMEKEEIDLSNVIMQKAHKNVYESSVSEVLLMISKEVTTFKYVKGDYGIVYYLLVCLCDKLGIEHSKHIQAKIEYNKTREHLHGKQY